MKNEPSRNDPGSPTNVSGISVCHVCGYFYSVEHGCTCDRIPADLKTSGQELQEKMGSRFWRCTDCGTYYPGVRPDPQDLRSCGKCLEKKSGPPTGAPTYVKDTAGQGVDLPWPHFDDGRDLKPDPPKVIKSKFYPFCARCKISWKDGFDCPGCKLPATHADQTYYEKVDKLEWECGHCHHRFPVEDGHISSFHCPDCSKNQGVSPCKLVWRSTKWVNPPEAEETPKPENLNGLCGIAGQTLYRYVKGEPPIEVTSPDTAPTPDEEWLGPLVSKKFVEKFSNPDPIYWQREAPKSPQENATQQLIYLAAATIEQGVETLGFLLKVDRATLGPIEKEMLDEAVKDLTSLMQEVKK